MPDPPDNADVENPSVFYDSGRRGARTPRSEVHVSSRRLLYQRQGACIDIELTRQLEPTSMVLDGQLSHVCDPLSTISDVAVALLAGDRVLARTRTRSDGGFGFTYSVEPEMRLRIEGATPKPLIVPLDRRLQER